MSTLKGLGPGEVMGWAAKLLGRVEDDVRPSIEKRIEAGTVLFRAGEVCRAVALIHDGEVELLVDRDGQTIRVDTRGRGAFVGDDEVLGDGIWHRTARALRLTRIEMLDRDVYFARFVDPLVSDRRDTSHSVARLVPASPKSASAMPAQGIAITDFPFIVGRASADGAEADPRRNVLLLDDSRPYHLSRRQFVIARNGDRIELTDPGSRLGTFVDGQRLGPDPLPLEPGQIVEVRAGGLHSPFAFRLQIER